VLYDMQPIVFDYYVHRSDIHGTEIRLHQELARSFATLIRGKSDAVDTALRDPYAKDSTQLDLQVLRAASRYPRVWLVLGPQFPGQLRESTAVGTLRRAFGRPRVTAVVGRYHIFLFAR
jgi:hypothetical protein